MKKIIGILLAMCLLTGCVMINKETILEQKVGQLFFVRCDDANIDTILEKNPGGILMFGVDFKDLSKDAVKEKIESYQEKSKTPLIIGVDEEGGTVVRVSSNPNLSDEKYKSPQKIFALGGMDAIAKNSKEKSELLKSLGINMNLAPVADISENPDDFIYDRSFGKGADETAEFVRTAVENSSIGSCLKHFPGYGGNVDTHTGIAIDIRGREEFYGKDFIPFRAGIDAGADAVLVSHNIVNAFDDTQPASISPEIHRVLREDLSFSGLIITDDMAMDAMKEYGTPYAKAVLAGNDLIIVSDFETAYNEVMFSVKNGTIPMEVIDEAYNRVMEWKKNNLQ